MPPTDPDDIRRYARIHDPFNHPTVIYRRSAVLAAGGYGDLPLMEDYWLFSRMLAAGARPHERVRAAGLLPRRVRARTSAAAAANSCARSWRCSAGCVTPVSSTASQYVRNVIVRGGYRLLPWRLRRTIYRLIVAGYGERRPRRVRTAVGRLLPGAAQ